MTDKNCILTPIDHAMHGLYELLGQLIQNGLTADEARRVLESMLARVLEINPATMGSGGTYTDAELERGREKLRAAREWRKDNPRAWRFIVHRTLDAAKDGKRVCVQELVEAVRAREFTDEHGKPTTINNDHAAVFARWLVEEFPQLDPLIERRASMLDVLMVSGWEVVADD